jgi:8-oxo-dGTP diphosphatase
MRDLRDTSLVAIVRHASAGDPDTWIGDDRDRPLDEQGRGQAEALRLVLKLFGVRQVASVPNVRCVDTVAGLAADLGVPVNKESRFEETAFAAQPLAGQTRLRHLAEAGGAWAVCSQGKVIPQLVAWLAAEDHVHLADDPRAKKGSMWALFFQNARLTAADYYPDVR